MQSKEALIRRQLELEKELLQAQARTSLLPFTLYTWGDRKPGYRTNWHHRLTCRYIDRWIRGEIKYLIIKEPPGHGKSELTSRRLPALLHGKYPDDEIIAASYSSGLASDMTGAVQGIMDTPEYKTLFPGVEIPPLGGKVAGKDRNSEGHDIVGHRGRYVGQGIGGAFTGRRARWGIIDDPIKGRAEADSPAYRKQLWDWFTNSFRNRESLAGMNILLTQTTWHDDDLGRKLEKLMKENAAADQYVILELPAFRLDMQNPDDPRTAIGEIPEAVLWPDAYSMEALLAIKAGDMRGFSALYQQRPVSPGGCVFEPSWWKRHKEIPRDHLRKAIFIDCASKKDLPGKRGKGHDYTVMAPWVETTNTYYLHDGFYRKKATFPEQLRAIKDLYSSFLPDAIVIEDASNGIALGQELLSSTTLPVIMWPCEGKEIRADRAQPAVKAGRCSLPEDHPDMGAFIGEHELFPYGEHDDCVDTTSIMIDYFRNDKPQPGIRSL